MLDDLIKTGMSFPQIQALIKNREGAKNVVRQNSELNSQIEISENTSLNDIKGLGQATRKKLIENGIKSKEDLLNSTMISLEELITSPIAIKGIKDFINNNKK